MSHEDDTLVSMDLPAEGDSWWPVPFPSSSNADNIKDAMPSQLLAAVPEIHRVSGRNAEHTKGLLRSIYACWATASQNLRDSRYRNSERAVECVSTSLELVNRLYREILVVVGNGNTDDQDVHRAIELFKVREIYAHAENGSGSFLDVRVSGTTKAIADVKLNFRNSTREYSTDDLATVVNPMLSMFVTAMTDLAACNAPSHKRVFACRCAHNALVALLQPGASTMTVRQLTLRILEPWMLPADFLLSMRKHNIPFSKTVFSRLPLPSEFPFHELPDKSAGFAGMLNSMLGTAHTNAGTRSRWIDAVSAHAHDALRALYVDLARPFPASSSLTSATPTGAATTAPTAPRAAAAIEETRQFERNSVEAFRRWDVKMPQLCENALQVEAEREMPTWDPRWHPFREIDEEDIELLDATADLLESDNEDDARARTRGDGIDAEARAYDLLFAHH